ncbi:unnamed protein product, partial [Staurois parvus]
RQKIFIRTLLKIYCVWPAFILLGLLLDHKGDYRIFCSIRHTFSPPQNGGICLCVLWSEYRAADLVFPRHRRHVRIPGRPLSSSVQQNLFLSPTCSSVQRCPHRLLSLAPAFLMWAPSCDSLWLQSRVPTAHAREALHFVNSPVVFWDLSHVPEDYGEGGKATPRKWERVPSLVISCTMSAAFVHLLYYVCSLWSSPVLCPQSLVISCTMSAVSGHLLYYVCSLWSSPILCPQCLVIYCTMSAVSGHLLYYVHSLRSSPVLCLQ